jgi:hypothetical protein
MEFTASDIVAISRPAAPGAASAAVVARAASPVGLWQVFDTSDALARVGGVTPWSHGSLLRFRATERRAKTPPLRQNYSTSLLHCQKQALFYSGRKKKHCDKNVVIVNTRGQRIDYLSQTYPGKTHDKKIADEEGISYPPGATLYKDTGFQGYEPAVKKTCQAKKKATPRRAHRGREANQKEVGTD